ncbi:MAG: CPBP family intramembrane metalloprotease [Acidobacteria bacterium]|nr:CPBP family intramembrane metalloprotease [Acidobacteriota bacterium]
MKPDFEPMVPSPRLPETPPAEVPTSLQYPFWTYEDIALFFGMGLPCLVLSVMVMEGLVWFIPSRPGKAAQLLAAQFIGYGLWFASLILLFRVRYEAPFWSSLAWVMPKQGFWRAVVQGPMLAFAIAWLGIFLQTPNIDMPFRDLITDRVSMMLTGVFAVTVGPLCEELAFRGFLMPLLTRTFGVWGGILITALPFALLHGPQYSWSWRHILLLLLAGVAFGRVRHLTGSTAASAMTHATYNLTFFSALVMQRGDWVP